jgi:hypothetical protein
LLRKTLQNHDQNQDGRLSLAEQRTITPGEIGAMRQAGLGGAWWAAALYAVIPNWQLFWLADALQTKPGGSVEAPDGTILPNAIPWSYVLKALSYVAGYLGASLILGLLLFENRELS